MKRVIVLLYIFLSLLLLSHICVAEVTISVDFNENIGTVPPYHLYMNHIEKVRGEIDHQLIKDLGPTVERAYWVIKSWAKAPGTYDFSSLGGLPYGNDPLFDDVIANGGEMLVSIQGNPSIKLPDWLQSSNPDFPNNLDDYQTVLEAGLRHLKQKYPQFKYLEAQNEPGGEIKVTADQFKLMNERVILAAQNVNQELPADVPKIIVGGPGIAPWGLAVDQFGYTETIFEYLNSKSLPVEFVSWHAYRKTPAQERVVLDNMYNLMVQYGYSSSPILITETGSPTGNPDNWPNSKCLVPTNPDPTIAELSQSAAFIITSYMQYMDSGKNATPFIFALSDYANNARSILVYKCIDSRDGKVNPLYNTLLMWSKLTGTRVQASTTDTSPSQNGVRGVAVKDSTELRILVINRNPDSADVAKVVLNNLPSQFLNTQVTYKRYLVDRQHNNYAANPEADLMKWNEPFEQNTITLNNGMQLDIALGADAVSLLVFSVTGVQTCSDGTLYNDCSLTKPNFCSNGLLINKCSQCDCPSGQTCQIDDTCSTPSSNQADNLILNPDFETGNTNSWTAWSDGSATFQVSSPGKDSSYAGRFIVTTPGKNVQVYQHGFALEPNAQYKLRFDAYSNTAHDLSVRILEHVSPYTNYGLSNEIFDLAGSWKSFQTTFTTLDIDSLDDARLMFWFGDYDSAGDEYYLDDIQLIKITASTCGEADTSNPPDKVVSITELSNYINRWKNGEVEIAKLMVAIGEWKDGC